MDQEKKADHIGIVACSAEGAALCYRTICQEGEQLMGPHGHPEVSLHSHSFARYVQYLERGDWHGVGALMLDSAQRLERVGADFLICPDNTIHQALPFVQPRSPLPWLHIAEVVAARASAHGYSRVGLTGTKWLVTSEVYPDALAAHGVELLRPSEEEIVEIDRIIMEELVRGVFTAEARSSLHGVIKRLKTKGCNAVILGCTELPLLVDQKTAALPTLDSTRLLARAALQRAVEQ